jgi:hypothetical protein
MVDYTEVCRQTANSRWHRAAAGTAFTAASNWVLDINLDPLRLLDMNFDPGSAGHRTSWLHPLRAKEIRP